MTDLKKIKVPVPPIQSQNSNAELYVERYKKYEDYVSKANDVYEGIIKDFEESFLGVSSDSTNL